MKLDIKNFIEKYIIIPIKSELEINKIPLVVDVPNILLKYLSFKISVLIKARLSKISYNFESIDENKF